ncbi:MAG: pyridoxamine 5'-phosphate oxidase family protein [Patescibacteria group bacterium]
MEENVLTFLKTQSPALCVFSTVGPDAKPESAVLAYAVHDDLSLVFSTHITTRKWSNLKQNDKVAVVFGMSFTSPNIQYQGVATLIENGSEHNDQEDFFYSQRPETARFKSETTGYIVVKPTWIRLTDMSQHPPKTEEKSFDR